jgi:aspartate racemase
VAAGADLIVLCTNTMHKVADAITEVIDVPFVHIADTTAAAVREAGVSTVGLLATGYTMEQDFYVGRLRDRHGLHVLVPGMPDRALVHRVIYDELCVGVVKDRSRNAYRRIMRELVDRGASAILLGCTEIDLLVGPNDALCRSSTRRGCMRKGRSTLRSSRANQSRLPRLAHRASSPTAGSASAASARQNGE